MAKKMQDNRKYHVLLVIRWPVGGIRTFIRYVYNIFDPNNYRLTILAPELEEHPILLNDLRRYEVTFLPLPVNSSGIDIFKGIVRALWMGEYDLIHSNGLSAGALATLPARLFRVPHMITLHDMLNESQCGGVKGFFLQCGLSMVLPLAGVIHAVSEACSCNILHYVPSLRLFKDKVKVIRHGIEIGRFRKEEYRNLRSELDLPVNSFLIGFLGRFMSPKGFRYLVEATRILLQQSDLPKEPFVLTFGDGAFIREEKAAVRGKRLERNIRFLPFTENVASAMKGLDVVAVPSVWETCPILPMEAMVAGVPIIGSDCAGLSEVLKNTPAVVVQSKNSHALAAALLNEMNNPSKDKAQEFRKEAASRFDVINQAEEIEKVMLSLMK
jgi:glycosyltransferase involved in cell wall biosynthesis